VEEREQAQRETEELRKLEEKKRAEIEEDWRWREEGQRAEEEKERREQRHQRREKGKGRAVEEDMPEARPSQPQKRRVEAEEGPSAKRLKVCSLCSFNFANRCVDSSIQKNIRVSLSRNCPAGLAFNLTGRA